MKPKNVSLIANSTLGEGNSFRYRVYTFKELAAIYYPLSTPAQASRNLSRFIQGDPALCAQLMGCGFYKGKRHLSPRMVSCIVSFMGTPEDFYEQMRDTIHDGWG